MKIIDLARESFVEKAADYQEYPKEWKSKGNKPCLVDFHALWCAYCKTLSPILDQLAVECNGKIDIYRMDVDQGPELEATLAIRIVPNLLLCPVGGGPTMKLGTMDKTQLKASVEETLLQFTRLSIGYVSRPRQNVN